MVIACEAVPIESRAFSVRLLLSSETLGACVILPADAVIVVEPLGLTILPWSRTELFELMLTVPAALPAKLMPTRLSALTEAVTCTKARVTI